MWKVLKSLFTLHNEFVNVWSHLCGAVFFVVMIVYISTFMPRTKLMKVETASMYDAKQYVNQSFHSVYEALPDYEQISKSYLNYTNVWKSQRDVL